jgi:hypothetical protein
MQIQNWTENLYFFKDKLYNKIKTQTSKLKVLKKSKKFLKSLLSIKIYRTI